MSYDGFLLQQILTEFCFGEMQVMLKNQSTDLQEQLDGVRIKSQDSEKALMVVASVFNFL